MKIPAATEQQKKDGWTFDYKFIEHISDLTHFSEFPVGIEEVETVLISLVSMGVCKAKKT